MPCSGFTAGSRERQGVATGIVNPSCIGTVRHQQFDGLTVALACGYQQQAIAITADLVDVGGLFLQEPGQQLVMTVAGRQGKGVVTGFIDLLATDA